MLLIWGLFLWGFVCPFVCLCVFDLFLIFVCLFLCFALLPSKMRTDLL